MKAKILNIIIIFFEKNPRIYYFFKNNIKSRPLINSFIRKFIRTNKRLSENDLTLRASKIFLHIKSIGLDNK